MKVFRLLVMLAFLLVGLIIGAVNSQDVTLDFLFSSVHTTSGIAIIVALLVGVLIGAGMVLVSVVIPLFQAAPGQQGCRGQSRRRRASCTCRRRAAPA